MDRVKGDDNDWTSLVHGYCRVMSRSEQLEISFFNALAYLISALLSKSVSNSDDSAMIGV